MIEGWHNDGYLMIFDSAEAPALGDAYGIAESLPDYRLVGLRGWGDFIVADSSGAIFTVPTVPLIAKHLAPFELPPATSLIRDERFSGRIKWYVKPIVFGGSPSQDDNIIWVAIDKHASLVKWWNKMYRQAASGSST